MRYKPPEVWDGGGAMVGREEISPQSQQLELRLVYLCSLVMRN